jgi:hypothetical protein
MFSHPPSRYILLHISIICIIAKGSTWNPRISMCGTTIICTHILIGITIVIRGIIYSSSCILIISYVRPHRREVSSHN